MPRKSRIARKEKKDPNLFDIDTASEWLLDRPLSHNKMMKKTIFTKKLKNKK